MPYSVNGIGTHYYGRRNESQFAGACAPCGRHAWLSSYDTLECVCVLFIPIVPLRRYRVQNQCSICTRHLRLPLSEFKEEIERRVAPLQREVEAAPTRLESQLRLIGALIDLGMLKEAEASARTALLHLPREAELKRIAGELTAGRGDQKGAAALLQEAVAETPRSAAARLALGRALSGLKKWEEAARELEEARRLEPENLVILDLLAEAHFRQSRWAEALQLTEQVLRQRPDLASDPGLAARVKKCKKALGYPLSEGESRAGSWWSRVVKRASGPAPQPSLSARQLSAGLAVIAGLAILVGSGVAFWRQTHVDVYFDNGLARPVTFTVDGRSFSSVSEHPKPARTEHLKSGHFG
jgi:tetratricopeptide (TPR) repeat protein